MTIKEQKIKKVKELILDASYEAHACHLGSALSCAEILVELFFGTKMRVGDHFIFSKASGAAAYYATMALKGMIKKEDVAGYLKHYPLSNKAVPGVIWSGGSLGHGLPIAVGLALANPNHKVFVLMGDGEIAEGTTWESVLFAAHHRLGNLNIIVDRNRLQACGKTEDILKIDNALELLGKLFPITVKQTTKGEGVDFMENDYRWHYFNLTPELLAKAKKQL
jgi:transketolase